MCLRKLSFSFAEVEEKASENLFVEAETKRSQEKKSKMAHTVETRAKLSYAV